ncbi:MAG: helix-hairpin-helix domain-containing protein [Bacteroidota bacterium]
MKTFFDQFFYFRRSERRAAWVLFTCCCLGMGLPHFYKMIPAQEPRPNFERFHRAVAQINAQLDTLPTTESASHLATATPSTTAPYQVRSFPFDPNQVSKTTLLELGLSPKCAQTLVNFRNKGGKFFAKADLKKIYGLADSTYQRLHPFIQLPPKRPKTTFAAKRAPISVDINQATAEEWQQLRGIGPYFAKRIIRFRESLGGFYQIDQVADTYHLPDSTFVQIRPFLTHSPIFRKLNINELEKEELAKHPYLNKKQATIIVAYRAEHGPFQDLDALKTALLALPVDWPQLSPYIEFNNP